MSVYELLETYNAERVRIGLQPLRMSESVREDLLSLASFTKRHTLDTKLWVRSQFMARGKSHGLRVRDMITEKSIGRFNEFSAGLAAASYEQEDLSAACVDEDRRGDTLTPLAEAAKRSHRRNPAICMAASYTLTLGWHPQSPVCTSCPLAARCRGSLAPALVQRREDVARRNLIRT